MDNTKGKFTPVFVKDDNRLVVALPDFLADDEDGAWKIGVGAMFVEGILYGFKFKNETLQIPEKLPHVFGTISGPNNLTLPIAVLSGPVYDQHAGDEAVVGDHGGYGGVQ